MNKTSSKRAENTFIFISANTYLTLPYFKKKPRIWGERETLTQLLIVQNRPGPLYFLNLASFIVLVKDTFSSEFGRYIV
jgi:hypothetical protein